MSDLFDRALAVVVGAEGGFTANPLDPGNWTGGRQNAGRLVGTKYGISAAKYPTLDIAALTPEGAGAIYKADYWDKYRCGELPGPIALVVFDCYVNGGKPAAWLQGAVGTRPDGVIGDITIAAAKAAKAADVVSEIQAQRMVYLAGLPTWRTFGLGWARRVAHLTIAATSFDDAAPAPVTLQTITPPPVVANMSDILAAYRQINAERTAA